MSLVDEEVTATSLGFAPYKRSYLPSRTYQAFVRIFPLSDQQSSQIFPSPPLKSGLSTQEKEENYFGKKDGLIENEVEDGVENEQAIDCSLSAPASNQIVGHVGVEVNLLKESVGEQLFDDKLLVKNDDERHVVEEGGVGGVQEGKDVVDNTTVEEGKISKVILDNADFEEGEISEVMEETNVSDDQLAGDSIEVNDRNREEQHIRKDDQVEQEGRHENGLSSVSKGNYQDDPSPSVVKGNKSVLGCRKTPKVKEVDVFELMRDAIQSKNDVHKTKQSTKSDSLNHTGVISESTVIMNEGKAASAKVLEASDQKKRVLTKERKAKKKANKRKKRAKEERESGVKRLKLQPISKPKQVIHCKYYINGKCHQGDACKFSHDITPVTKSKPCNFLALNQCLKGKDCPYDHDLSKYPCDNFKSKGFCSRGDTCLFSHKIPLENDSSVSDANKTAADSGKQPAKGSNSQQALNVSTNMTPMTPSSLKSINRFPGKSVVEMKTPAQAPKGISFLSFGKSSSETPVNQQKCDLPSTEDNGAAVGSKNQGGSEKYNNSNGKSGKMLVTTQSLSQPPKRTSGVLNYSIFNSASRETSPSSQFASKRAKLVANPVHEATSIVGPLIGLQNRNLSNSISREPSLDSQFASKWGNLVTNTVNETPATLGPVAGGQVKNMYNSAPREPSSTSQFASKWGNPVTNTVPEVPATVGPVTLGQHKNTVNSSPEVLSSTCQFASKWGNLGANTVHKAPASGGHNKKTWNYAPNEQSPTSQFALKRANPMANTVHVAPTTAGLVTASKCESNVTGKFAQSAAPNIPSVSSILQELLSNNK